jgi:hypothetical protein
LVPPVAALLVELEGSRGSSPARAAAVLKAAVWRHKVLAVAYAVLVLGATGFVASGGNVLRLSVYGQEIQNQSVPSGYAQSVAGHFAQIAFGLGVLPFVVGFAWLLANCFSRRAAGEARVFACIGAPTLVLVVLEVTKYDLGFSASVIFDRYLFYLVPIVLLAFSCAVLDRKWPRWSLLLPTTLVCLGFALRSQASFTWQAGQVSPDSPVSILYHPILRAFGSRAGMEAALVTGTIILTALFALAGASGWRIRARLGPVLMVLAVLLTSVETGYVFVRLFRQNGLSYRSLTATIPSSLAWVDSTVGPSANVTMIPYHVSTDYLVSEKYWRDLEFWNKSVDREVEYPPAPYNFTGIWFPKPTLSFNSRNGEANISPSKYVVQAITDVRFGLAGTVKDQDPDGGDLVAVDVPWRASFETFGTYDDGWLRPNSPAIIRVFAAPAQRRPRIRYLSLQLHAPRGIAARPYQVRSNVEQLHGIVTDTQTMFLNSIPVCVPASGHADVTITADGTSTIPGDMSSYLTSLGTRQGSLFMTDGSVNNLGPVCTP